MGLSDGVWPLIGKMAFASARHLATLMASSLPEDDHRFRTHSIKAFMWVAILTVLTLAYHMIISQRKQAFYETRYPT